MKVLSLFDGISVAQQALKELGVSDLDYFSSEIDKYAISLTQCNHPMTFQLGDVKNVGAKWFIDNSWNLLQIDLLIGGSPCQDLSISKKNRQGLSGERSGLFYEYVRILKEVRPKYFILENVNSMPLEAKVAITMELFNIPPIMINAALVAGQSRKRLFWVGKLVGDTYEQVKIKLPEDRNIFLKDLIHENRGEEFDLDKYVIKTSFYREKGLDYKFHNSTEDSKATALRATDYKGTHNIIVVDKNKNNNEKLKSNTLRLGGAGSGIEDKHNWDTIRVAQIGKGGQGDRIYSIEGKSVCLSANGGGRGAKTGLYRINGYDRKITPIECERLQSLPDNYTAFGKDLSKCNCKAELCAISVTPISNTQRYKALGNAFNCEVIKHILKHII